MNDTRSASSAKTVLWILAFAAILSHLPAVGFDLAQDDFTGLARALDPASVAPADARLWTTTATWTVLAPLFGTDPAPYHGVSLLLLAAITVLAARLAIRLGAGNAGAILTGLLFLLGPTTGLPVAWVSASNELWAALFALIAVDRWLVAGSSRALGVSVVAAILSFHSKESALALGPGLWLASRWLVPGEGAPLRRLRTLLAVVMTLAALQAGRSVVIAFDPLGDGAYALASIGEFLQNLVRIVGWAVWPVPHGVPDPGVMSTLGLFVLILGGFYAERRRRADDFAPFILLLALLTSALPAAAIGRGPEPYHALLPAVVVAVAIGRSWRPAIANRRGSRALLAMLGAAAAVSLVVATGLDTRLRARGTEGQLEHPILRRSSVAHAVRTQIESLRRARPQPTAIGVVQASRLDFEDPSFETGRDFFVGSPVYLALRGDHGLRVLSRGGPEALWVSHVDDVPDGGFVFLDPGDAVLRPLGPPSNARLYTALIAVAAGQFARARHDLWGVVAAQGVQVRFAFDPANLPITAEELDAEAEAFARFLTDTNGEDGTVVNVRLLRLFEQIYETVRGKELVRDLEDIQIERAPRFDG